MSKTIFFVSRLVFLISCHVIFTSSVSSRSGLAEDLLKYTNDYRKSKKLSALEMRADLNAIARSHSDDMARGRRGFGHG
ncbi:MAG TPA: CAP domain-containing protein, partial [Chitinophagaceae bacterium]|nr:CAP domain-containing protein [Chitinophagaceae bacterium]